MRKRFLYLSIIILPIYFIGCNEKEKQKAVETKSNETTELNFKTADYEIVKIEDQSRKAIGKKNLSEYEKSELEELPTNKKMLYRIVLSKDTKENQVKPTVEKIINKLTDDNSDIDEIILWLYSDTEMINNGYDIGEAIWAPYGNLGNVDANIAKNNNRDNYVINYQIKNNLDQYLALRLETNDKFGFTIDERKQIFKESIKAEDKAFQYEKKEQSKILEKAGKITDAQYNKINKETEKLMTEYKLLVAKKYNITIDQLQEINDEAQDKYWSMD